MEVVVKYLAGATIWVRAYVYDSVTEELADPTSIKLTLADADGTTQVAAVGMTKYSTGIYDYYYNTSSSSAEGWWPGEVWVVDGTKTSSASFSVEVRKGL